MKLNLMVIVVLGVAAFSSCRKDGNPAGILAGSDSEKIKDSVLSYTRDIYLWYSQVPGDFNPRAYADPDKIMVAVRDYSREAGFDNPVDRWSFGIKKVEWDNISSGAAEDFGLSVFFIKEGDLRVKYVEKDSPASRAGIRRGWRVTKINGNANLTIANSTFITDNIFSSRTSNMSFQKPDSSSVDVVLNAGNYQQHPVFLDSIYTAGSKKVGYLVFNSFLGDTLEIFNQFNGIFNRFSQGNVDDVVIDLRYNGGGFVNVQTKLANYLINAAGNGGIMMNQEYNDKYKQMNSSTTFAKLGSLNLSRVFFVVSKGTASASELLINNLKPYLDVKVVGPSTTYGKPVGFFPIPVSDWYIFPVSFRTTNKNAQGNYYNGIPIDNQVQDGLDKDWGDRDESCLASVLKYVGTGSFSRTRNAEVQGAQSRAQNSAKAQLDSGNSRLDMSFKGAIDTRRNR